MTLTTNMPLNITFMGTSGPLMTKVALQKKTEKTPRSANKVDRTTYNYSLAGGTVLLINDTAGAYYPILNFTLKECSAMASENHTGNWNCIANISLKSSYYNPIVDQWEPFLELYKFQVFWILCAESSPKQEIIIKADL